MNSYQNNNNLLPLLTALGIAAAAVSVYLRCQLFYFLILRMKEVFYGFMGRTKGSAEGEAGR